MYSDKQHNASIYKRPNFPTRVDIEKQDKENKNTLTIMTINFSIKIINLSSKNIDTMHPHLKHESKVMASVCKKHT